MGKRLSESDSDVRSELQAVVGSRDVPKVPLWKMKGYYKKGQMVRRRRTRMERRDVADKKYGMGIVLTEVERRGQWLEVEIYWQGLKRKVVEKKSDVERVIQKVETVVLPQAKK